MTHHDASEETVGECGVCSNSLPVGANHAFTVCKHLFCISCLLRWHKANPMATCPMCRAPLESEPAAQAQAPAQAQDDEDGRITLEEMDLNQDEESMHNHMLNVVDSHADQYCLTHPGCTYMESIYLYTIRDQHYDGIEVGAQNLNCHYVIELRDTSRAFRYKFGRIEEIRMPHPMFQGISWFVFRELIETLDDDTGHMQPTWSPETQRIVMQGGDVKSLRQYVPRMRMSV
jgi:hypothetical protein